MAHILVVESSAKKEGSFSRKLASEFVDLLRACLLYTSDAADES